MPDTRMISAAVARRFLILHHLLAPPRSLPPEKESVMRVLERLGSLQFDPLAIAGRNHDLSLAARIAGYRPAWTDELLYSDRVLVEGSNKMLSILPMAELPWYRVSWDRARRYHEKETFPVHAEAVESIVERIRAVGPLSSLDFEHGGDIDWYWRPTNRSRALLEALWEVGTLAIARRAGNRRYYDLTERVTPAAVLGETRPEPEQLTHKLLSIHRAHGLASPTGTPEMWLGVTRRDETGRRIGPSLRTELRADLVAGGLLKPLAVEGLKGVRYLLTAESDLLDQAEAEVAAGMPPGGHTPGITFLAPLDPLAWDRDLLRRLFGFDYVWEVYVPAAKRRWGYYVLPILFGDRFVGRIEPRIERDTASRDATVRIAGLWWEAGVRPRQVEGLVPAMKDALAAYRRFAGARTVEWPSTLAAAGRLFGAGRSSRDRRASEPGTSARASA